MQRDKIFLAILPLSVTKIKTASMPWYSSWKRIRRSKLSFQLLLNCKFGRLTPSLSKYSGIPRLTRNKITSRLKLEISLSLPSLNLEWPLLQLWPENSNNLWRGFRISSFMKRAKETPLPFKNHTTGSGTTAPWSPNVFSKRVSLLLLPLL